MIAMRKKITVIPSTYSGRGQAGDFEWMLDQFLLLSVRQETSIHDLIYLLVHRPLLGANSCEMAES